MRTSGWPADTLSPSSTSTAVTVPISLVLSVACRTGAATPVASNVAGSAVSRTEKTVPSTRAGAAGVSRCSRGAQAVRSIAPPSATTGAQARRIGYRMVGVLASGARSAHRLVMGVSTGGSSSSAASVPGSAPIA
jgi:hypothetical protein